MSRFSDLDFAAGSDGIYDLVIDVGTADLAVTDGLESATFVSLFSDRRARADEVADPLKRRGWIGDLVSNVPDDRHGSGIWLYEQRRLTGEVVASLRLEAQASLDWMIQESLARTITSEIRSDAARRTVTLILTVETPNGGVSSTAYVLASATRTGLLARI